VLHATHSDEDVIDAVSQVQVVEQVRDNRLVLDEVINHRLRFLNKPKTNNLAEIPSKSRVEVHRLLYIQGGLDLANFNRTRNLVKAHESIPDLLTAEFYFFVTVK
jgi:hypothetical protein